MVSVGPYKDGKSWEVRWDRWETTLASDGAEVRRRRMHSRKFTHKKDADLFAAERRRDQEFGRAWRPETDIPVASLAAIAQGYVDFAVSGGKSTATVRFRCSMLGSFLAWAGRDRPVTDLSASLLDDFHSSLPRQGRQRATARRKLLEVERAWAWAASRRDRYPGVPAPQLISPEIEAPPPVASTGGPTMADLDAMLGHLVVAWHHRVGVALRYTGLRASQVLGLEWGDIHLDRGFITVRAGRRGSKGSPTRAIPIHPAFATVLATWGPGEGCLFPRSLARSGPAPSNRDPNASFRGDVLDAPFVRAWKAAEIPEERWAAIPPEKRTITDRANRKQVHAFRAAVKNEMLRKGVDLGVADLVVGHAMDPTMAAYTAQGIPEHAPLWPRLVAAVATLPPYVAREPQEPEPLPAFR